MQTEKQPQLWASNGKVQLDSPVVAQFAAAGLCDKRGILTIDMGEIHVVPAVNRQLPVNSNMRIPHHQAILATCVCGTWPRARSAAKLAIKVPRSTVSDLPPGQKTRNCTRDPVRRGGGSETLADGSCQRIAPVDLGVEITNQQDRSSGSTNRRVDEFGVLQHLADECGKLSRLPLNRGVCVHRIEVGVDDDQTFRKVILEDVETHGIRTLL
mmetsp:Transcript_71653/g.171097  ORF Transcript_71653/g.171097 Transcript_71653/m.171097 type:complete len:212 (+) Transcript_71653:64-699(+)